MSSKGKQQVVSSFGRELAAALEGSIAAGKDAAVQQAEKAAGEARAAANRARQDGMLAQKMRDEMCTEVTKVLTVKSSISSMLERNAKETRAVVGRGVMLCAFIAVLELIPFLLLLWAVFRE